ncbi:MAG: type II secretion system protein N [Candidatus Hydrogenedentota bacterium]
MLKALLIRQSFLALDFVLALLVAGVAFLVVSKYYEDASGVNAGNGTSVSGMDDLEFAEVDSRSHYAQITESGLFGDAARSQRDEEPEEEPEPQPVEEVVDHGLPLTLRGTARVSESNPYSRALIENAAQRNLEIYAVDDVVLDQIVLEEVGKRRAILFNQSTNERLVLRMDEDDDEGAQEPAVQQASGRSNPAPRREGRRSANSGNEVRLGREEVSEELTENYAEIINQAQPQLHRDESGEVAGLTAENISQLPLADKLNLRDGDVIQTVNGIDIDSEERIMEILNRFGDLDTFRVGILRDGEPEMMTYRLE